MQTFELEAEAGQVSAELMRLGVSARSRVNVVVRLEEGSDLPMAAIAQEGGAFDWLASEPELYTDADSQRPR